MLKQSGKNLESGGTNENEIGIGGNQWESMVTRRDKQGITEKDKGTTEKKGNYRKHAKNKLKQNGDQ